MRVETRRSRTTSVAIAHLDDEDIDGATALSLAEQQLRDHCAVLLRGLPVTDAREFRRVVSGHELPLRDYRHGNSPRTAVIDGVYTSTDYPAKYDISLHSEMSYAATWPTRIFFACLVPPEAGGQTCLSDTSRVLRALSEPVRERFRTLGLVYIQNLHNGAGFGKSWQQTYDTDDRLEVESYLRAQDVTFEWRSDRTLRTYQHRPATRTHPRGFDVWFNQADQWHPSNLPADEEEALRDIFGLADDFPLAVRFGDGTEIPDSDLDEVRSVAQEGTIDIEWQRGDLLIVDNMAALHGRRAYSGARQILVAMS